MAVLVYDQPELYGLAGNDNPFVFRSTNYTPTQRFKIVVLPAGYPTIPALSTVRVYPRQSITQNGVVDYDRAYYDPSRILQTQLGTDIAIPSSGHAGYFDSPNMHFEYNLFIQEEDLIGGVWTLGDLYVSSQKSVWNGGVNLVDWLTFDYDAYDMDASNSLRSYLTQSPTTKYIDTNQSASLGFLSSDNNISKCNVVSYDAAGAVVQSGSFAFTMAGKYGRVAIGTYDLTSSDPAIWTGATPSNILVGASYYTIQVEGTNAQKLHTYHIDAGCSKYETVRLHWLNRLGAFDSFNFDMKSTLKTSVKRDSFVKEHHGFTGTRWKYDTMSSGETNYHTATDESLKINSDYMSEDESVWMEDLFTSPVVYREVRNELIAYNISGKSITRQTSLNDKLMQYTFDVAPSLTNTRQRG